VLGLPHLDAPLTDGHVALREWTDDDADAMTSPLNEGEIARWTTVPSPYTRADAEEFLRRNEQQRMGGEELGLAIVSAFGDDLLGSIGIRVTSWEHRRGDLGYLVFEPARRRGVAPRAVRLLARFGFERLGLRRMEILTATGNEWSQRVAEKAGFTREGVLRSHMDNGDGERLDMVSYSLLPEELQEAQLGTE
jgi:RimJ/RimL family protein N-acetyltransferase